MAAVAILVGACASAGPIESVSPEGSATAMTLPTIEPQNPAAAGLSGWIAHFSNGVMFIQWVDSGGCSDWHVELGAHPQ
jgi:hypothetical protein